MFDAIDHVFFRVSTPYGEGVVFSYYREMNYIFGIWTEKKEPDYTYKIVLDDGGIMTLKAKDCTIILN